MRTTTSLALLVAMTGCTETITKTEVITTTKTVTTTTTVIEERDPNCTYDDAGNPTLCRLSGVIVDDKTLTNDRVWMLVGGVFVGDASENPATLTIEPGTRIVGDTVTRGFLVVRRNSKIEAVGTPDEPIVFTSANAAGNRNRSDWGGIVINGNAPLNTCDVAPPDSTPAVDCEAIGEGGSGFYGGTNASDDSGTLQYVRIEFGGYPVTPNDELNGLALQGVGSGTTIDHVHIHMGGDDGIEFFGGTVNAKYIAVTGALDDLVDWTFGWTGKAQYVIGQVYDDVGNHGIEADNNETNNDFLPRSAPQLSNFTLIGQSAAITGNNDGVLLRRGTAAELHSFVIAGFDNNATSYCFEVNGSATVAQADADALTVESSIVDCVANFKDANSTNIYAESASNLTTDPGLVDAFDLVAPDFAPEAGSAAASGGTVPADPFFDVVTFRGAVDPADNWFADGLASGWISTDRN